MQSAQQLKGTCVHCHSTDSRKLTMPFNIMLVILLLLPCIHPCLAHRRVLSTVADLSTSQPTGVAAVDDLPTTVNADAGSGGSALDADTTRSLLRNCYAPHRAMDVVVNHYAEDLLELRDKLVRILQHPNMVQISPCVVVYTKATSDPSQVAEALPFASVRWLPNVGREGHSWTHHFATHYDNLADQTMTLQGSVECEDLILPKLDALTPSTGFMCLCWWDTANCTGTGGYGFLQQDYRLAQLWTLAQQDFCFGSFNICYRGQFIVSARRVRHQPAWLYHRLHTLLGVPGDHEVHQDSQFLREPTDMAVVAGGGPNAPLLGHTLERAWSFMFNCHHPLGPPQLDDTTPPTTADANTSSGTTTTTPATSSWGHTPPRLPPQHVLTLDGSHNCDCFEPDPQARGEQCGSSALAHRACQCLDRALLPHPRGSLTPGAAPPPVGDDPGPASQHRRRRVSA